MTSKVTRYLYSAFLRLARKFDKNPQAKVLIYRDDNVNSVKDSAEAVYFEQIGNKLLWDRKLYNPRHCNVSFVDITKHEFRDRNNIALLSRIDAAFAAFKLLSSTWSSFEKEPPISIAPRTQKWGFTPRYAHKIQPGILLAAHPMVEGRLGRTVILVLEHSAKGTYGLVLNDFQANLTMATATRNLSPELLSLFGKFPVSIGGGIAKRLQILHPFSGCSGSWIPNTFPPLYFGGDIDKIVHTASLIADLRPEMVESIDFYAGCLFWNPGSLADNITSGYFIPVQPMAVRGDNVDDDYTRYNEAPTVSINELLSCVRHQKLFYMNKHAAQVPSLEPHDMKVGTHAQDQQSDAGGNRSTNEEMVATGPEDKVQTTTTSLTDEESSTSSHADVGTSTVDSAADVDKENIWVYLMQELQYEPKVDGSVSNKKSGDGDENYFYFHDEEEDTCANAEESNANASTSTPSDLHRLDDVHPLDKHSSTSASVSYKVLASLPSTINVNTVPPFEW